MNNLLERNAIKRLVDDIENLNSTEFEFVGHMLVGALENKPMLHRGLNLDAKPVGYTVDTFDSNRTVVAEYSTEDGYFTDPYNKIAQDAKHAIQEASDLTLLYLFSNRNCPNSAWEGAVNTAKDICASEAVGVEIYDSRRLAEVIYAQVIKKTSIYESFIEFLPSLEIIWRDYQFAYNRPPLPSNYVKDPIRENELLALIRKNPVVVIHGISGIGKSYLLRAILEELNEFDNILWLTGDDVGPSTSFTSIKVQRLGASFNLTGKFNYTKTLLVIDGWEECLSCVRFSELELGLSKDSRIIISSQIAPEDGLYSFAITDTDPLCAKQILNYDISTENLADDAIDSIIQHTGGHPLLLSIINGLIKSGDTTFLQVVDDIENWPGYEDPNTQSIILERILSVHAKVVEKELKIAKWVRAKTFDREFILHMIGPSGVAKLRRHGLLRDHSFGMLRFHDLVFLCLLKLDDFHDDAELTKRFLAYFYERSDSAAYHFQRSLHTCATKIIELCERLPIVPDLCHYLYLLLDLPSKNPDIVNPIVNKNINDYVLDSIAIDCIIESREVSRLELNRGENHDAITIGQIKEALNDTRIPQTIKHTLFHHLGKAYRRSGDTDNAIGAFKKALELSPAAPHTHLQISRLTNDNKEKIKHLNAILSAYKGNPDSIAITVVLAAIEEAGRLRDPSELEPKGSFLDFAVDAIATAQAEGYGQPFITLATIGRALWYNSPDKLIDIADRLSLPTANNLHSATAFGIAETMKSVAKAFIESGDSEKFEQWLIIAEPYYSRVTCKNVFYATMVAEYWILRRDGNRSLEILNIAENDSDNVHFYHRRSQAHALLKDYDTALKDIDLAIKFSDKKYRATFLDCKAKIQLDKGRSNDAICTWVEALTCCSNEKFKGQIQCKIEKLTPKS